MHHNRTPTSRRDGAATVEALEARVLMFGSANHLAITAESLGFLTDTILSTVNAQHKYQDSVNGDVASAHFDGCYFAEGAAAINGHYQAALAAANPDGFRSTDVATEFGRVLHAAQDFYAHSNWV